MSNPQFEELAAWQALGLNDAAESNVLRREVTQDPDLQQLVDTFAASATLLAYDAPQVSPPPALKRELMKALPQSRSGSKIISFAAWVPYAIAACLMVVIAYQANEVFTLDRQVGAEHANVVALQARNEMAQMRLALLEAKDAGYISAKVMVAWDSAHHNGVVSIQNLPAPPAGHDYQLWVLDPTAPAPLSAGLLKMAPGSHEFTANSPVHTEGPGFAVSLEPAGGRPAPTGAILFAVAPER